MVQRTVLKVNISCEKCKKKILKAVSGLPGVDKIEIDEDKGILTVTGEADPYKIIVQAKKSGKFVEVVTIGPPPPPPKKPEEVKTEEKKPDTKKPEENKPEEKVQAYIHAAHSCPVSLQMGMRPMVCWEEPNPSCTIM